MSEEHVRQCEACGASIYREHLNAGIAGYWEGQLICAHCMAEREKSPVAKDEGQEDMEAVALIEDEVSNDSQQSATHFRAMSETQLGMGSFDDAGLSRPLAPQHAAATRCRTFHAKLNDGAIAHMNREINEWVDRHPDLCVKFATSTVGVYEGKRADPHLILTLFY